MDEIRLMYNARVYGDIEPLLQCLEAYGLQQPEARKLVANLARGLRTQAERNPHLDRRNHRIAAMVANSRGLLKREGKDPRQSIGAVERQLSLKGDGLERKQIKRIWDDRAALFPAALFEPFYQAGLEGFQIRI